MPGSWHRETRWRGDPPHRVPELPHGSCKGAVGAGTYPALANDPTLAAAGYSALIVVNGSKDMPPFGTLLDDEQVAAVVNYVRSHFGNSYPDTSRPST